jgi:tetratricopeptide (TPR) repeat protein
MPTRSLFALAVAAALFFATPAVRADALVKVVPTPDMARLSASQAEDLRQTRADFDKTKPALAGESLAEAYAMLGAVYAGQRFYDAAEVALEDAVLLAPKDGRWVYAQGVLASAQKRNAVAQNYFDLAFGLNQEYLPIRVAVARSKFDNGDFNGARTLLDDYVAKHDDQAVPYAILGEIALRQKRYPDAIAQTERALALDANATRLYATLADAQAGAGDAKAAAQSRAKAGNGEPVLADPLGQGLLGQAPSGAAAAVINPQAKDVDAAALALAARQYAAARQHLDNALKRDPNNATLLALYARVEAAAGNLIAAKSRAAAAIAADSNNALAHLSQGVALEMAADDGGAQRAYEQAIRADAKLAEPRLLLGALLMRTGRSDAAIAQFRALVQLDFGNHEGWTRLAAADVVTGKCAAALRDVSDVLAKDADNPFLLQLFVRLASTCPAASADQKRGALQYGAKLYRENATAPVGEAYALALAANGKWDDAVKTQQAAMFILVRNGFRASLPAYREFLQQFQGHRMPDRPWPASAAVFHPTRLAPDPKPVPDAATPKK